MSKLPEYFYVLENTTHLYTDYNDALHASINTKRKILSLKIDYNVVHTTDVGAYDKAYVYFTKILHNAQTTHHPWYKEYCNSKWFRSFLSDPNSSDFKYAMVISLSKNDAPPGVKITNVTSNVINAGKATGVTVSKSKTDKDIYVYFDVTPHFDINYGLLFAKKKEDYLTLKMALQGYHLGDVVEIPDDILNAIENIRPK